MLRRVSLGCLIGLLGVEPFPGPSTSAAVTSPGPTFNPAKLAEIEAAINADVAGQMIPGGVFWLERRGEAYHKPFGNRAVVPAVEAMTEDTVFDAASLTKVVACTPAVMRLVEQGRIHLDDPVVRHLPEFAGDGRDAITLRHLLTHVSGLRPDVDLRPPWSGYDTAIKLACVEKLTAPPGTVFRYSDINFFLLSEVVRRVSGLSFQDFVAREIYGPLGMADTGFLPPTNRWPRIAPTQVVEGTMLRGVVHDPTARRMGGVAGHAGLFTTAADLARYCRMLLNLGALEGVRVFKPETVKLMTSVQTPAAINARRGLGWDIDSGYSRPRGKLFPLGSYGHTGFTGTSIWIDPFSETFWIFLSNRVHPDGKGNVLPLQAALGTLAAAAVNGFDFENVAGALPPRPTPEAPSTATNGPPAAAPVLNGIDVLVRDGFLPLRKLRVGLITNHSGVDRNRNPTIDLLRGAADVELKALFSPEHGIRGALDEKVDDSVDDKTGLPVYSLYGVRRSPAPEQLQGLDALVFDIQDIGCRFYTYISTMGNCLEAAAQARLKFFVLDRVNPIGGVAVEGPVHPGTNSFTAYHAIPLRHGLTVGELARMLNVERGWNAALSVIAIEGWNRKEWFDQTGLPWINPSPNMRSLTAATLYPGVGLLETAVSVGRGTETPFEVIGAPYVDEVKLAAELDALGLAGVRFVPVRFSPAASVFKGQPCGGIRMLLTDRDRLAAVDLGVALALTLQRLYPAQFALDKVNTLLQDKAVIEAVRAGKPIAEIRQLWTAGLDEFKRRREPFLLYR